MPAPEKTKTLLMDETQTFIQTKGHNGFSIRDLANKVGIKAASIYHHFPNKADLVASVARRYTENFLQTLEDEKQAGAGPEKLLEVYISMFRSALIDSNRMCMCGALAAELEALPPEVRRETKKFFDDNIAWLSVVFVELSCKDQPPTERDIARARGAAMRFLSALEGAMLMARVSGDQQVFEETAENLVQTVT